MKLQTTYERISKSLAGLLQKNRKEKIFDELTFAGVKDDFELWLGKRIFISILAAIIGALLPITAGKYFNILAFEQQTITTPIIYCAALGTAFFAAAITAFLFEVEAEQSCPDVLLYAHIMPLSFNM